MAAWGFKVADFPALGGPTTATCLEPSFGIWKASRRMTLALCLDRSISSFIHLRSLP